jgi:hypothetical protein
MQMDLTPQTQQQAPPATGRGGGIDTNKPPISLRLIARSDPANAPKAFTPVPMVLLYITPAGPGPSKRIRPSPSHGGIGE